MMNENSNIPTQCPSCNSDLVWSDTGVDLLCENPLCPAQLLYKIENFLRVLEVEELSSTTLEKFNLTSIEDVYKLTFDYIVSLDGFQDRKATIILDQLDNSLKNVSVNKLIAAFGIPGVGIKNAEKIVNFIKKNENINDPLKIMDKFFNASSTFFIAIDGLGNKITEKIINQRKSFYSLYTFLLKNGLTFKEISNIGTLNNLNVAMTGSSPDGRNRSVLENLIEEQGGTNCSVSKKTDILVAENPNGSSSKIKNAQKYGIKIISYSDFFENYNI